MTQIYLIRHAEPNFRNHSDAERELTPKGLEDRRLVTDFLMDKGIDAVLSSPYRRAVDTVRPFAEAARLPIEHVADFRERRVDSVWIDDFDDFCRRQWADMEYRLSDGESLREVQERNVAALQRVLDAYEGRRIAIGGHGTAISVLLNHFDPAFGYDAFERIRRLMPWAVRLDFQGRTYLGMETFDLTR